MEGLVRYFVHVVPIGSEELEYCRVLENSSGHEQLFCPFNHNICPEYDSTIRRPAFARYLSLPLVLVHNLSPEALPGFLA